MAKATLNGTILAETDHYEIVEGNVYFPPESIHQAFFQTSDLHTTCPWKGIASYYDIVVAGQTVKNGAWYYPNPKAAANNIKDHVAFYGMVKVER